MADPRWTIPVPPLAEVRLVGAIAEKGKLTSVRGETFCRITLQVGGADYPVIARNEHAEFLSGCKSGDTLEVRGMLVRHAWSTREGRQRETDTVEAGEINLLAARDLERMTT